MKWFSRAHPRLTLRAQLKLEQLEDRMVPSGNPLDLSFRGAAGAIGGVLYEQCDAQPTGTGFINSFVRVQTSNANSFDEQGSNTHARPLQFDENKSPQFTPSLPFSEIPQINRGTEVYRQFLLDVNQKASASLLSLDELQIFVATRGDLRSY